MCTGKLPSVLALKDPTPPQELNPAIPPALSDLVLQLLARDPADRPQTAHEVWERLDAMQSASSPQYQPRSQATNRVPGPSRDREGVGNSKDQLPPGRPQHRLPGDNRCFHISSWP